MVSGTYKGEVTLPPGAKSRAVGEDLFVVKYAADMKPLWARAAVGESRVNAVQLGSDGSVSVVGYFTGTVDFFPGVPAAKVTAPEEGTRSEARASTGSSTSRSATTGMCTPRASSRRR